MAEPSLDLFGRMLMTKVRDEAISQWRMIADGKMKGERARKLREVLDKLSAEQRQEFLSLVPSIVDSVLHHLLWMFEQQKDLSLGVVGSDQGVQILTDLSDGLAGEMYSDAGWIERFSKEKG